MTSFNVIRPRNRHCCWVIVLLVAVLQGIVCAGNWWREYSLAPITVACIEHEESPESEGAAVDDLVVSEANYLLPATDKPEIPTAFVGRFGEQKQQLLKAYGGSNETEHAIELALLWLATRQKANGSWRDSSNKFDLTGLVVLAYLGAGHCPNVEGRFRATINRGILYLLRNNPHGDFCGAGTYYQQGIGTLAIVEAAALVGNNNLTKFAQEAVTFTADGQAVDGGWRYMAKAVAGDTSITSWVAPALMAAKSCNLTVPPECFDGLEAFLDKVQGNNGATYGYIKPGDASSTTAGGLWIRVISGQWPKKNPAMEQGAKFTSTVKRYHDNLYGQFMATQFLFQYGGEPWSTWNREIMLPLVELQNEEGSWPHEKDQWASVRGPILSTCLATLILETYYRYPRILRDIE